MASYLIYALIAVFVTWRLWRRLAPRFGLSVAKKIDRKPRTTPLSPRQRSMIALRGLTVASMKMYFRNRSALFFSFFFPVAFVLIFGLVFKNTSTTFRIDVVNQSTSPLAHQFVQGLGKIPSFEVKELSESEARSDLDKSADLEVVVPPQFGTFVAGKPVSSKITTYYNEARPQNGQAASQILSQIVTSLNGQITQTPQIVAVDQRAIKTRNFTYIDFLLPGMVALSVMQLGIFSVAFGFISFKTTGMLRRLKATPTHPSSFLAAQGFTRLVIAVGQTVVLVVIGLMLFNFHLQPGSWLPFLLLAMIGSAVFMGLGFAIAGWAKDENQAAPVANLVQFPMMFLSGTFFPRDGFPPLLKTVTGVLPLTYLSDAMRHIANDAWGLWAIRGDLLGLLIWGIIFYLLANRLFRWE